MRLPPTVISLLLAGCAGPSSAQVRTAPPPAAADPMLPTSSPADALVSPLQIVTVATGDLARARRFYQGALDMSAEEVALEPAARAALATHWGIDPNAFERVVLLRQPFSGGSAAVRLVEVAGTLPTSRPGTDSRYLGGLGFGLAGTEWDARDAIAKTLGFQSSVGVIRMDFPRADKTTYTVSEIHFQAPDDLLVLGVDRGDMAPVGPIDAGLGIGTVAYSSMLVGDLAATDRFLADVLGLERRRDISFRSSGPGGGMLGLAKGEEVAFQQWFAPGASTGYLVVMERLTGERTPAGPLDLTSRGLSMLSFRTDRLDEVARRWAAFSGSRAAASRVDLPGVGPARAIRIASPDGLPVEVYQPL